MIFGYFNSGKLEEDPNTKIKELRALMKYSNSTHQSFLCNGFNGNVIQSGFFPYTISDIKYQDEDNDLFILCSGHIYNSSELNNKLELENKKVTNPELVGIAYQKYGPNFVRSLNGDFVITIYDHSKKKFFIFRDHLGIRPLAYTLVDESIWFSSDIISLCRVFHPIDEEINSEALLKDFKFIDHTLTPNATVEKLLSGHYLECTNGQVSIHKYWFPEKIRINRSLQRNEMLSDMKKLVFNAVRNRCDKTYIAATHLSGGLDSGIIAAFAREQYRHQDRFYGFSWSPKEHDKESQQPDERELVVDQAKMNDITPKFSEIGKKDYLKYSNEKIKHSESFAENDALRKANELGINLLFSGYGGDEFISKNDRGIDTDLFFNLQWKSFFKRNKPYKVKPLARRLIYEIIMPFFGLLSIPVRKAIKSETQYLIKEYKKPHRDSVRKFYFYKSRRQLHLGFLYCYYLPVRMEDWYINGFKNGVEYRYPLLDKDIIEYMLTIPSKLLIKENFSRSIIRELSEGILPESVRWKKSGADPSAYESGVKIISECAVDFSSELDAFRKNQDLKFIDFDKLTEDLEIFRQNPDTKIHEDLISAIFNIKQLHEFVQAYRKSIVKYAE